MSNLRHCPGAKSPQLHSLNAQHGREPASRGISNSLSVPKSRSTAHLRRQPSSLLDRPDIYSASAQLSNLQSELDEGHGWQLKRRRQEGRSSSPEAPPDERCMVYIYRLQPGDTFPSLLLKFHTSASTILKANRLWAHDNIHSRSILFIPVQECKVIARPLSSEDDEEYGEMKREEGQTYTHHKWVDIPGIGRVEVAILSSQTLTYFPPGRRKPPLEESLPRESFESQSSVGNYLEDAINSGINKAFEAARRRFKGIGKWTNDLIEL